MESIISKELLSAVLEIEIRDFEIKNSGLVYINIRYYKDIDTGVKHQSGCESSINIHELAHKCKEWARINRYDLCSWITFDKSRCSIFDSMSNSWDDVINTFEEITEPEAIFKACQWILDNK